jgi:apolipoprotein N-acyltransferase
MRPSIFTGRLGELVALIAGSLLPLSLAPFPFPWMAPVSILVLLCAVLQPGMLDALSPTRFFLRYFLFGVGSFGVGASWVYVSVHDFGYTSVFFALFVTALWVSGLSLVLALPWWLWHRQLLRLPSLSIRQTAAVIGFSIIWMFNEWMRSWLLTGFPWLYIGYSQTETWLGGWAPLLGVYGVGLAVVLPVTLLFRAWTDPAKGRALVALGVMCLVVVGGWFSGNHHWTQAVPDATQSVVMVQGNVAQEQKWRPEQRDAIRSLYRQMTQPYLKPGQLVVWPEAAIPELYVEEHPFFNEMQALLIEQGGGLITGVPSLHQDVFGHRIYYNSLLGLGEAEGFYHKRRLVPFGEYVPMQEWLSGLLDFFKLPISDFRRGPAEQASLSTGKLAAAGSICYEIAYPDLVASQSTDADFLLTVSNDSWFGASLGPHQHLQMAQMRARENGRMLLRATSNGITAVVGPSGTVIQRAPQFQSTVLEVVVQAYRGVTPFQRFGSAPVLVFGLIVLCWIWRRASIR